MKTCRPIFFLINLLVWLVGCPPQRRKNGIIQNFHRKTAEVIAVDHLIQNYEKEHLKFYLEEAKNGAQLEWPTLDSKNLSNYCRKYLQHSVPTVKTDNAIGNHKKVLLHYEKINTDINGKVVTVYCKVKRTNHSLSYYITRAPKPNCVYSLKRTQLNKIQHIFTIICKHCDFEEKPFVNSSLKRKREEITSKIHKSTGQPIAKDEYLLEYELEHQGMLKKDEIEGKIIEWPHVREYRKLDDYCYQYIKECTPYRQRDGSTGSWKPEKLHYQKLNTKDNKDIIVTTVTCTIPNIARVHYYMTRAPESNCVYALLRQSSNRYYPFVIIFKHCDFKKDNNKQTISQDYDIPDGNVIPKLELKEETDVKLETFKLFPEHQLHAPIPK